MVSRSSSLRAMTTPGGWCDELLAGEDRDTALGTKLDAGNVDDADTAGAARGAALPRFLNQLFSLAIARMPPCFFILR